MSAYTPSQATPDDAEAIANLFALSWQSPFAKLQLGNISTASLALTITPRITETMSNPGSDYLVMRANDGTVAAVAQWRAPPQNNTREDEKENVEPAEEKADSPQPRDQTYRNKLPETSNKDLIMAFNAGLRELREEVLRGRRHFLLENIATHPEHRRQGLASELVRWAFPRADKEDVLVYLDTASNNEALRLYKRLGFEERGRRTIEDLGRYGGEGAYTHVALVRVPLKAGLEGLS